MSKEWPRPDRQVCPPERIVPGCMPEATAPTADDRFFVKVPGPGQFRGEGTWRECEPVVYREQMGYLPTHRGPSAPEGSE